MAKSTHAFSAFEWMIAGRYLRAKRQESLISVISGFSLIGIALGVAVLIIVMSVMNGFRAQLLGRILGLNGHMVVQSLTGGIPDFDQIVARVKAVPGVVTATPVIEGQVMVSTPQGAQGAQVRGIRPDDLKVQREVAASLTPEALADFAAGDSVIIGQGLAAMMGLQPGGTVTLLAPRGDVTPFGTTPRQKTYRIAGLFSIGMSEYDRSFIFMPLEEAQAYFGTGDTVQGIMLMVQNPDTVMNMRGQVLRAAGDLMRVVDWQQINISLFDALQVERVTMFLILTLIILVAALNVISGLIMLVKEKGPDIAIMRTMGASKGAIMRIFFIAGASVGVTGTILGLILAMIFLANIEGVRQFLSWMLGVRLFDPAVYYLSRLPAEVDPYEVVAVVAMALTLSFLATLYPSWRAARLDPVEALRYE